MDFTHKKERKNRYLNPYVGGFLLGLILLMTVYITGRGLGASGAVKSTVVTAVDAIASKHAHNNPYMGKLLTAEESPMSNWLVFEVLGILVGAFLSGAFAGRLKLVTEHQPKITSQRRLLFAALGGIAFGIGSQFGRGCTSGTALTGMATLSLAGFIGMLTIFGSAFLFAWFFRKLWI